MFCLRQILRISFNSNFIFKLSAFLPAILKNKWKRQVLANETDILFPILSPLLEEIFKSSFVSFLPSWFFVFFCCFLLLFFLLSIFRFEEVFKTLCRLLVNVLEIKTTKLLFHWEIWYYQLSWNRKLASVKNFKAHVSRLAPRQSETIRSDEGLTLETSALQLFTMANLRHQLCW